MTLLSAWFFLKYTKQVNINKYQYYNCEVGIMDAFTSMFSPSEAKGPPYPVLFLAELLGTAIMMFIGCMGCIVKFPGGPVVPAVSFGLAIAAAIQGVGHISGAHINPAVSLGVLILGKMNLLEFVVYVIAQFAGAVLGYGILWCVLPSKVSGATEKVGLCELSIGVGMTPLKVFAVEVCASWVLMFAICGMLDMKNQFKNDSAPIRVGFIAMGIITAALPLSGAGLNPARAVPSSVFPGCWCNLWIWIVGPLLGMALAAAMYRFLFESTEKLSLYSLLNKFK